MGKKVMQCKPAPEITLKSGEEEFLLRFNVNMWAVLQENENGLEALKDLSMPETCALIVHAAGKDNNEDFTLEKARALVSHGMDMENIKEIIDTFSESVGLDLEKLDPTQKKMMLNLLNLI